MKCLKCLKCGKEFEAESIKCEMCSKDRGETMYHLKSSICGVCNED